MHRLVQPSAWTISNIWAKIQGSRIAEEYFKKLTRPNRLKNFVKNKRRPNFLSFGFEGSSREFMF